MALSVLRPGELTVAVSVHSARDVVHPDYDSFAWQVLTTLATSAAADSGEGEFTIRLTMESGLLGAGL